MILTEFLVVLYADHVRFHPCHPESLPTNKLKNHSFKMKGDIGMTQNMKKEETRGHHTAKTHNVRIFYHRIK